MDCKPIVSHSKSMRCVYRANWYRNTPNTGKTSRPWSPLPKLHEDHGARGGRCPRYWCSVLWMLMHVNTAWYSVGWGQFISYFKNIAMVYVYKINAPDTSLHKNMMTSWNGKCYAVLAFVRGIHRWSADFPCVAGVRLVMRSSLMLSLMLASVQWTSSRVVGDLRRTVTPL